MGLGRRFLAVACAAGVLASCTSGGSSSTSTTALSPSAEAGATTSINPKLAASIDAVVQGDIAQRHLRAVIVRVTIDGKNVITKAYGESMTGVPATTAMHFRNGAVAISYVSTILLQLVDEKKVSLDDKISRWVPQIPHSDEVTLGQLAQMTSGYPDYVIGNPAIDTQLYLNPYRQWMPDELISGVTASPLLYPPGTNWNYAHTNYVILGLALEKITGKTIPELMQTRIFGPMGLTNTSGNDGTPVIPEPALHSFTSERRSALGIPAGTRFYEESTYWNPSWTITHGGIQTTDIFDVDRSAIAIGTGKLLSPASYQRMISPDLRGKTQSQANCTTCFPQNDRYAYGLGIVVTGDWLMQDPLFSGEAGAFAYQPSQKVAISVAVTFGEEAFDPATGDYVAATGSNGADLLWRDIGQVAAPKDPPPDQRK